VTWGVDNLVVRFGSRIGLDGVSLSVAPGEIHAVIGGDGSGKTTLLRVLAGIGLDADGRVLIPPAGRIGYVPSNGGVFPDLTVAENLEFVAAAYRLRSWRERGRGLLDRAGLERFRDRLAGNLSGGQRRKLAGSLAMLPEPDLLILDEVTTGVDPVSRVGLWRLVASAAAAGSAVVIATTYFDEAERTGAVTVLHSGKVIASGSPAEIRAAVPGRIRAVDRPGETSRAWRMGRRWHEWLPKEPREPGAGAVSLADAAIVAEIASGEAGR
jgi:ABC-2 type transport system ATP-binding protein